MQVPHIKQSTYIRKGMGRGNTRGFHLGVCRGMGMVLTFYTHKHTIPLARGTMVLPPYRVYHGFVKHCSV